MLRTPLLLTVILAAVAACKPRGECTAAPLNVQFLAIANPILNPDDDSKSWPTNIRIYELKHAVDLERLDFHTVLDEGEKAFGDALVKSYEQVIYPDRRKRWTLALDPSTTHVITVGLFRQPIADAWYQASTIPSDHAGQRCEAERHGKTLPDPCLFLAFERNEIAGGRFPPAGFDTTAFETACAPIVAPPKKKPKKKKRRSWRLPDAPQTPQLPQPPQLPQTPQVPQGPTMPSTPTAPQAPRLPGR